MDPIEKSASDILHGQLYPHQWLALPFDVRMFFIETFNIPQSGSVHVVDNRVESDGRSTQDLHAITVEKMQKYLQHAEVTDTFESLIIKCISKYKNGEQKETNSTEESSEDKGTVSAGDEAIRGSQTIQTASEERVVPDTSSGVPKRGRRKNDSPSSGNDNQTSVTA